MVFFTFIVEAKSTHGLLDFDDLAHKRVSTINLIIHDFLNHRSFEFYVSFY